MPHMKCYHCGTEYEPDRSSGYCDNCGNKLPIPPSFGPETGRDREKGYSAKPLRGRPEWEPEPDDRYAVEPAKPRGRHWEAEDDDDADSTYRRNEIQEAEASAKKKAAGVLFAVAALQLICGTVVLFVAPEALGAGQGMDRMELIVTFVVMVGIGVLFAGLGVWALFQPFPAAVIGLVLYILITLADVGMAIAMGAPQQIVRGILVKIIIVIALVHAVQAGAKASKLRQSEDY